MGIVVALEGQLLLGATILSMGGEILGSGLPFLETLGSSSDFAGVAVLASYGADLVDLLFCSSQKAY